ncbi:hypothetical protein SAMN02745146_0312 [Hymenobacter daecheongensis DSM 21074]|uniref:Uncharacterized protein n=1 Tax=Hymenobacter daecheongensis DSM 21074 TaxID=1121955 RepID=A0A1M6MKA7_9BACT|nr:hypothetical protein [Hymenobacter daecheongensis]SHJ83912.1 hypothetical protein SAMN02745146_0312 [Hymenobacter daecheongensis DSM 21074]
MKPIRFETLLYTVGALLVIAGAVVRIGHLSSAATGFTLLIGGFLLGSVGQLLTFRRTRQLQARNRELEAKLANSQRKS